MSDNIRHRRAVTVRFRVAKRVKIEHDGDLGILPVDAGESLSGVPSYRVTSDRKEVFDLFLSNGVTLVGVPVGLVELV